MLGSSVSRRHLGSRQQAPSASRLPTSLISGPWRTKAPWNSHGLVDVMRKSIEAGGDVNEAGAEDGYTPLMLACSMTAFPEVVDFLLEQGADVNATASVCSPGSNRLAQSIQP